MISPELTPLSRKRERGWGRGFMDTTLSLALSLKGEGIGCVIPPREEDINCG
jgi:hypothetical protein